MKRLLLILLATTTFWSCNWDRDPDSSVLADIIGEWELQSRTLNNETPIDVEEATLVFTEDDDIEDTKGYYALDAEVDSSGLFFISLSDYLLNFEDSNGNLISYDFEIINATLVLVYRNNDGDDVEEIWRKTSNYIE